MIKYPHVTVKIYEEDANAFAILGNCAKALKENDLSERASEFMAEATKGDYQNLLNTVMEWFNIE